MSDSLTELHDSVLTFFAVLSQKSQEQSSRSRYEKDRIAHAKRIMKPFFLRRLKSEVLTELPKKSEFVIKVPMTPGQYQLYSNLVTEYKERAKAVSEVFVISRVSSKTVNFLAYSHRSQREVPGIQASPASASS